MSQFAIQISDDLRSQLTLPTPPMWDKRSGELIPYADSGDARYTDVAIMKKTNVVYVDEELDVFAHPGSTSHYRMMIRHMPWRADLLVILAAARHMLMIGEYSCEYDHREGLSPELESGFWDVKYKIPHEQIMADCDTLANQEVVIPYAMRKKIWMELFAAMGHKVKWGGLVLNVRKRKP